MEILSPKPASKLAAGMALYYSNTLYWFNTGFGGFHGLTKQRIKVLLLVAAGPLLAVVFIFPFLGRLEMALESLDSSKSSNLQNKNLHFAPFDEGQNSHLDMLSNSHERNSGLLEDELIRRGIDLLLPSFSLMHRHQRIRKSGISSGTMLKQCDSDINILSQQSSHFNHFVHEKKILAIRVIGERHTGVDELISYLSKHLINVTVSGGLTRDSFWFQTEPENSNFKSVNIRNHYLDHVLVLVVTRHPYEWMMAMKTEPLHAPSHHFVSANGNGDNKIKAAWKKFVGKPWVMKTSSQDKEISSTVGAKCQEKFNAGEVIPCRKHDPVVLSQLQNPIDYPVYETHVQNHQPFKNIIELRRAKLINQYNVSTWMKNTRFVQLESLLPDDNSISHSQNKLNSLLKVLNDDYNIPVCMTVSSSNVNGFESSNIPDERPFKDVRRRFVGTDYEKFEKDGVSWLFNATLIEIDKAAQSAAIIPNSRDKGPRRHAKNKNSNAAASIADVTHIRAISEEELKQKLVQLYEDFEFLKFLTCNLHWRIEQKFGYNKIKNLLVDERNGFKKVKCTSRKKKNTPSSNGNSEVDISDTIPQPDVSSEPEASIFVPFD